MGVSVQRGRSLMKKQNASLYLVAPATSKAQRLPQEKLSTEMASCGKGPNLC